jgi:protein-disulfide isomerase
MPPKKRAKARPHAAPRTPGQAQATPTASTSAAKQPGAKQPGARLPSPKRPGPKRSSRMSPNMKFLAGLGAAILLIAGFIWFANRDSAPETTPAAISERLVRADSHRLGTPAADGKVTLVEFLDFECESCKAAYPSVERIREEYDGKITYVLRYFPLPGHRNGVPAARAAQAAANQGKLEPMYRKLFETQASWGEKQEDQTALFESYAQELGLDLAVYRADVTAAATASRIDADVADGKALGVTGTPTFYLNGAKFTGRPDYAGLKTAIDAALAS